MQPDTIAQLESLGPMAVAKGLAQGTYGEPDSRHWHDAKAWLDAKALEASERAEARADESLSISKNAVAAASAQAEAASLAATAAFEQARWAKWAAILAAIAAVTANKDQIFALIF